MTLITIDHISSYEKFNFPSITLPETSNKSRNSCKLASTNMPLKFISQCNPFLLKPKIKTILSCAQKGMTAVLNLKEKMTECTIKCPRQGVCKRVALQYVRDGGQRTQIMTTKSPKQKFQSTYGIQLFVPSCPKTSSQSQELNKKKNTQKKTKYNLIIFNVFSIRISFTPISSLEPSTGTSPCIILLCCHPIIHNFSIMPPSLSLMRVS